MIRPSGDTFELNLDYFTHHRRGVRMKWNDGAPIVEPFHSQKLIDDLGPMRDQDEPMTSRHDNIAKSETHDVNNARKSRQYNEPVNSLLIRFSTCSAANLPIDLGIRPEGHVHAQT